jgi:hypothetical protein
MKEKTVNSKESKQKFMTIATPLFVGYDGEPFLKIMTYGRKRTG